MNTAELSTEIQHEQENMLSVNEDSKSESVEVAGKGLTKLTMVPFKDHKQGTHLDCITI